MEYFVPIGYKVLINDKQDLRRTINCTNAEVGNTEGFQVASWSQYSYSLSREKWDKQ